MVALLLVIGLFFLMYKAYKIEFVVGLIIAAIAIYIANRRAEKKLKESEEVTVELKKKEFYTECINEKILQLNSEKNSQKAELIAEKYGLSYEDIHTLFLEAQHIYDEAKEDELNEKLEEIRNQETQKCQEYKRYMVYSGKDKRIAMLVDLRNDATRQANELKNLITSLFNSTQQREKSWSVAGGIAEGIAGPIAGLATAIDIQNNNAQIRAKNAANAEAIMPNMLVLDDKKNSYLKQASNLQREIDRTQTKLVSDLGSEECFSHLSFSDPDIKVSETGTCTVTVTIAMKDDLIIFEDIHAVIDGTINAQIYDGDNCVGTAVLVLPVFGIKEGESVTGLSLFCGKADKQYSICFESKNLWAMERQIIRK